MKSLITQRNGKPTLLIDGVPVSAVAYTTYFEERSRYEDFLEAGYRIFFVNLSFTVLPINPETLFTPFHVGVFEDPSLPDYSEFEAAVSKILAACPDAIIFPRIYVSMPQWWVESHPDEVYVTDRGHAREIMFSEVFRRDASELLAKVIKHIKDSSYAPRIGGWMICGASTQEFLHRDSNGDLCPAALKYYAQWLQKTYGEQTATLPQKEEFEYAENHPPLSENARRYSFFSNLAMAETLDTFAEVAKRETNFEQVVGAFYGYLFEARSPLFGTHGLRAVIDSPNLDFFSSPNAYLENRPFGIDWVDMMPVDTMKAHGKLVFMECDIRTYLTTGIQEARPLEYPDFIYTSALWAGPPTPELSREALRKCFAHQITKASAIWWFDMWGGWFRDPLLMEALADMRRIYDKDLSRDATDCLSPEVVFFADERGHTDILKKSPYVKEMKATRVAMGKTGVPYDSHMVEDAEQILRHYKAAVFPTPFASEEAKKAMALCKSLGVPYLSASDTHKRLTVDRLCEFYKENGIHFYSEERDVVYLGNGYVALHSKTGGEKRLHLPKLCTLTPVFGADLPTQTTDVLTFELAENATALFALDKN